MPTKTKKSKTPTKKQFKVFESFEMIRTYIVDAKSQKDAEDQIDSGNTPTPYNEEYVSDSTHVVREFTLEFNAKSKNWESCQN